MNLNDIAHEIWATAQLLPNEGIEDGVVRIESILKENQEQEEWISVEKNNLPLKDSDKILLIDKLLSELKVDNFSSCMDRPNRRNYKGLLRDGEEIGMVMIKKYGK